MTCEVDPSRRGPCRHGHRPVTTHAKTSFCLPHSENDKRRPSVTGPTRSRRTPRDRERDGAPLRVTAVLGEDRCPPGLDLRVSVDCGHHLSFETSAPRLRACCSRHPTARSRPLRYLAPNGDGGASPGCLTVSGRRRLRCCLRCIRAGGTLAARGRFAHRIWRIRMSLDPDIQALLGEAATTTDPPSRSASRSRARRNTSSSSCAVRRSPSRPWSTARFAVDGGEIGVRVYTPEGAGPFPGSCTSTAAAGSPAI